MRGKQYRRSIFGSRNQLSQLVTLVRAPSPQIQNERAWKVFSSRVGGETPGRKIHAIIRQRDREAAHQLVFPRNPEGTE